MHAVTYQAAMMLQPSSSTSDTPHTVYPTQEATIKLLKERLRMHANNKHTLYMNNTILLKGGTLILTPTHT